MNHQYRLIVRDPSDLVIEVVQSTSLIMVLKLAGVIPYDLPIGWTCELDCLGPFFL